MINAVVTPDFEREPVNSLLRRFKKSMDRANVIREWSRAQQFIPRAAKRLAKSQRARKGAERWARLTLTARTQS
jgi:ribosomal protein S21